MLESSKKDSNESISFKISPISTHLLKATIEIAPHIVETIYAQTINLYKKQTELAGFKKKEIPKEYLEENYKLEIENTIKNYLFKHFVLDFLIDQIHARKILIANYPRLVDVKIFYTKQIIFVFDISIADPLELKEWKHFVFRAPKRKKYKDLDKQVTTFIKKEVTLFKKQTTDIVEENDWVYFDVQLIDENQNSILDQNKSSFWIKINNKYIQNPFQATLVSKKINDSFLTNELSLKNDFSEGTSNYTYPFLITIKNITKGSYLFLESLRLNFKLKNKIDVQKKLIEVFSYRNDLSQRKAIIEELFHLLLSKHRFEVPKHFVIRREEDLLSNLKQHPDYQVYKQQKDFFSQIEMLSEKQLKEEILIDQITYEENIKIEEKDIQNYLSLFNNNRLKEFIYFKPQLEKIEDSNTPIQLAILKQATLREKTLNYIIHTLTK